MQIKKKKLKEFNNFPKNTLFGLALWAFSQHIFQEAQVEITRFLMI